MLSQFLALRYSWSLRSPSLLLVLFMAILLSSTGSAPAFGQEFSVSPGNLDFQTVAVGQQKTLIFHIQNTSSALLQIYKVSSSRSEFSLAGSALPASIAPWAGVDFKIAFSPNSAVKTTAILEVVSNARAIQSFTLTGTGKEPLAALQLSPSSLNFGSQKVNSLTTRSMSILNSGEVPLTISGVTVMGSGFSASNVYPGMTLAPKQQATVQVSFRPLSSQVASGKLTILSGNLSSAATLPLAGTGVSSAAPATSARVATASVAAVSTSASSPRAALTTNPTSNTIHLAWGPSSSSNVGYRVYRGSISGGPYPDHTAAPISALAYDDASVVVGSTYYYVVTSVGSSGLESKYSNEARATVPGASSPSPTPTPSPVGPSSLTTGITRNGSAAVNGTRLRLTNTGQNLAGSGWYSTPVNVQTFSNDFTFQMATTAGSTIGNGLAFVIQNAGTKALGPSGGGLGYGPDNTSGATSSSLSPIAKSVAIKFDTVSNAGEGLSSTGLYKNGASPTMPAVNMSNNLNLRSGDIFKVHMSYDGTKLSMTITDTKNTAQTFTTSWTINIPSTVGGNTAYVGFTGATGYSMANQDIITWTYGTTQSAASKTPIVYASTGLAAVSSGPTFRTFAYSSFPDGVGTILDATAAKDNVTFTIKVPTAGTYDIKLSYKQIATRGISQLAINGTSVGAPLDQYIASEGYATFDFGKYTFASAGNHSFKFTILGKNASASGYSVSFDDFTLTPQ